MSQEENDVINVAFQCKAKQHLLSSSYLCSSEDDGNDEKSEYEKGLNNTPNSSNSKQKSLYSCDTPCHGSNSSTPTHTPTERQQIVLLKQLMKDQEKVSISPSGEEFGSNSSSPTLSSQRSQSSTPSSLRRSSVFKRNSKGESPLHIAAKKGDLELIKDLIKEGADLDCKDYANWTPLHEACNQGCYAASKLLVKAGASINARGLDDITPLHDAASNGFSKIVNMLLRYGADSTIKNKKGEYPIDVSKFHPHVVDCFQRCQNSTKKSKQKFHGQSNPSAEARKEFSRSDERPHRQGELNKVKSFRKIEKDFLEEKIFAGGVKHNKVPEFTCSDHAYVEAALKELSHSSKYHKMFQDNKGSLIDKQRSQSTSEMFLTCETKIGTSFHEGEKFDKKDCANSSTKSYHKIKSLKDTPIKENLMITPKNEGKNARPSNSSHHHNQARFSSSESKGSISKLEKASCQLNRDNNLHKFLVSSAKPFCEQSYDCQSNPYSTINKELKTVAPHSELSVDSAFTKHALRMDESAEVSPEDFCHSLSKTPHAYDSDFESISPVSFESYNLPEDFKEESNNSTKSSAPYISLSKKSKRDVTYIKPQTPTFHHKEEAKPFLVGQKSHCPSFNNVTVEQDLNNWSSIGIIEKSDRELEISPNEDYFFKSFAEPNAILNKSLTIEEKSTIAKDLPQKHSKPTNQIKLIEMETLNPGVKNIHHAHKKHHKETSSANATTSDAKISSLLSSITKEIELGRKDTTGVHKLVPYRLIPINLPKTQQYTINDFYNATYSKAESEWVAPVLSSTNSTSSSIHSMNDVSGGLCKISSNANKLRVRRDSKATYKYSPDIYCYSSPSCDRTTTTFKFGSENLVTTNAPNLDTGSLLFCYGSDEQNNLRNVKYNLPLDSSFDSFIRNDSEKIANFTSNDEPSKSGNDDPSTSFSVSEEVEMAVSELKIHSYEESFPTNTTLSTSTYSPKENKMSFSPKNNDTFELSSIPQERNDYEILVDLARQSLPINHDESSIAASEEKSQNKKTLHFETLELALTPSQNLALDITTEDSFCGEMVDENSRFSDEKEVVLNNSNDMIKHLDKSSPPVQNSLDKWFHNLDFTNDAGSTNHLMKNEISSHNFNQKFMVEDFFEKHATVQNSSLLSLSCTLDSKCTTPGIPENGIHTYKNLFTPVKAISASEEKSDFHETKEISNAEKEQIQIKGLLEQCGHLKKENEKEKVVPSDLNKESITFSKCVVEKIPEIVKEKPAHQSNEFSPFPKNEEIARDFEESSLNELKTNFSILHEEKNTPLSAYSDNLESNLKKVPPLKIVFPNKSQAKNEPSSDDKVEDDQSNSLSPLHPEELQCVRRDLIRSSSPSTESALDTLTTSPSPSKLQSTDDAKCASVGIKRRSSSLSSDKENGNASQESIANSAPALSRVDSSLSLYSSSPNSAPSPCVFKCQRVTRSQKNAALTLATPSTSSSPHEASIALTKSGDDTSACLSINETSRPSLHQSASSSITLSHSSLPISSNTISSGSDPISNTNFPKKTIL